jgi:hypothetical protein
VSKSQIGILWPGTASAAKVYGVTVLRPDAIGRVLGSKPVAFLIDGNRLPSAILSLTFEAALQLEADLQLALHGGDNGFIPPQPREA